MSRPSSTEAVLVGAVPDELFDALDLLPNVSAEAGPQHPQAFVRRAHTPYVLHDADPLRAVGDAWVAYFDGTTPVGTLEVAVEAAIAELRGDTAELPDYFLVIDGESLPVTRRHWWFGAVAETVPSRVVPAAGTVDAVRRALGALPPGRWWPDDTAVWLRSLAREIPDQAGLPRMLREAAR